LKTLKNVVRVSLACDSDVLKILGEERDPISTSSLLLVHRKKRISVSTPGSHEVDDFKEGGSCPNVKRPQDTAHIIVSRDCFRGEPDDGGKMISFHMVGGIRVGRTKALCYIQHHCVVATKS
jgi:hypothetical protein